jgi:hypothetical protein
VHALLKAPALGVFLQSGLVQAAALTSFSFAPVPERPISSTAKNRSGTRLIKAIRGKRVEQCLTNSHGQLDYSSRVYPTAVAAPHRCPPQPAY